MDNAQGYLLGSSMDNTQRYVWGSVMDSTQGYLCGLLWIKLKATCGVCHSTQGCSQYVRLLMGSAVDDTVATYGDHHV